MVTSSQAGEGKTTTICNLAVTYALEGKRVLLIDADLRKPSLHRIFLYRMTTV
ncbi:AAA family ATPase [Paenibacillus sp. JTLBN-2024]